LGTHQILEIVGHEVHSTFGSVLNSYGFVGFLLFLSAIGAWMWQIYRAYGVTGVACMVGPALIYGISHNGIRFTIFWLLFATSLGMASRVLAAGSRVGAGSAPRNVRTGPMPAGEPVHVGLSKSFPRPSPTRS
jgi:hypothetical protein